MILKKIRVTQLRRRLRISSFTSEFLLHTSRKFNSVIKHDETFQKTLKIYETFINIKFIHIERFVKKIITETHNQNVLTRNL